VHPALGLATVDRRARISQFDWKNVRREPHGVHPALGLATVDRRARIRHSF
jgi:hypothetical protein